MHPVDRFPWETVQEETPEKVREYVSAFVKGYVLRHPTDAEALEIFDRIFTRCPLCVSGCGRCHRGWMRVQGNA